MGNTRNETSDRRQLLVLQRGALRRLKGLQLLCNRTGVRTGARSRLDKLANSQPQGGIGRSEQGTDLNHHVAASEVHIEPERQKEHQVSEPEQYAGHEAPQCLPFPWFHSGEL